MGQMYTDEDVELFKQKKQEMLERIAETLYQTLYRYLDYLNHVMTVCADFQISDKGCPYDKCKMKGVPMTLGDLKNHLENDCNKIMLECSRCHE